jgi:hypothetical protein
MRRGGYTLKHVLSAEKPRFARLLSPETEEQKLARKRKEDAERKAKKRAAANAEARRAKDAARKKAERGRRPRAAWLEENNLSAMKPWDAQGISRSTWYRREAKAAAVSQIASRETGASVRSSDIETGVSNACPSGQVCPSASIQYNCINSADGQTVARSDATVVERAAETQSSASVPPFPIASYPPQPSMTGTHTIGALPLRIITDLAAASPLMDSEAYAEPLACT